MTTLGNTVAASGGTLTLNSGEAISINSLSLQGATLTGSDSITVPQFFTWTSGTMSGTGSTTLSPAAVATLTGSSSKTLTGRALINQGTVNWTDGAIAGTGTVTNQSGGVFNANATSSPTFSSIFTNQTGATLNQSGSGTTSISGTLDNLGTVNATGGTLDLTGTVTQFVPVVRRPRPLRSPPARGT